jgi:hypothetical protein
MSALNFNGTKSFVVPFPRLKNVFFDSSLSYQYLQLNESLQKGLRDLRSMHSAGSTAFVVLKKPKKDKVVVCQIELTSFWSLESKLIAAAIWSVDTNNLSAFIHHYCENATNSGKLVLEMSRLKQLCEMYNSQDGYYTTRQKYILSGHQNNN